jgi:P4 family phage/plasmid primase-like protien
MTDFVPTHDWQPVPPGAVLPPGCQTEMDMETGGQRARLALEPHLDDARRLLELLDGEAEFFTFQIFDDTPRKDQNLARTLFGEFDRLASILHDRQHDGCGVFVTVNRTKGGKRRAECVDLIRAAFTDLDGAPLDPVLNCALEPHIAVESSPGKFHAYWICEGVELEQFTAIQKAIAARFGGDKSVHDLPRVMRLPGFWHLKGEPFRSRIVQVNERLPYTVDELLAEFPPGEAKAANGVDDDDAQTMADLVRDVLTAESYHEPLTKLAWRWLAGGMDDADVVRTLRSLMENSDHPRDERWTSRYNDIERTVETAKKKFVDAGTFDLTDDGLALAMARDWERDSSYCDEFGRWIFWRNGHWEFDRTKLALSRTRFWLRTHAETIIQQRPSMAKKAAALRDDKTIYAIAKLVACDRLLASVPEDWDSDPMKLGGRLTVDLRSGENYEPRPSDRIIKRVGCDLCDAPPIQWLQFLDEITGGDKELQDYLQRMCGYWLTGLVNEHVFFFFYGTGANGKSVFINTMRWVLGDYATVIGSEVLMVAPFDRHPTELAKLRGMRLAVASEIERGKVWAESKIKSLTGGDKIQARFMRQDFFEYTPQFKLVVVGNYKPSLRAVDEAVRRRLHLVPFTVTIPEHKRDKDLEAKLCDEGGAIFRWALEGCALWCVHGLQPTDVVRAATEEYLASEDAFELWREACTILDKDEWADSAGLWHSWRLWADNAGEPVGSQKVFGNMLAAHGFVPKDGYVEAGGGKRKKARGYAGLRLNTTETLEEIRQSAERAKREQTARTFAQGVGAGLRAAKRG